MAPVHKEISTRPAIILAKAILAAVSMTSAGVLATGPTPRAMPLCTRRIRWGTRLTNKFRRPTLHFPFPNTTTLSTFSENGNWPIGVAFITLEAGGKTRRLKKKRPSAQSDEVSGASCLVALEMHGPHG